MEHCSNNKKEGCINGCITDVLIVDPGFAGDHRTVRWSVYYRHRSSDVDLGENRMGTSCRSICVLYCVDIPGNFRMIGERRDDSFRKNLGA